MSNNSLPHAIFPDEYGHNFLSQGIIPTNQSHYNVIVISCALEKYGIDCT